MDSTASLWKAFSDTFLVGDAYLVLLKGLAVTVAIAAVGIACGVPLAALLCWLQKRGITPLTVACRAFIAMLRGCPVLVVLMLFYFVVFATSRFSPIYIAFIAFALHCGAHMAEIFRASVEATDPMQFEAARMLGFSKLGAFRHITMPQAWRIARPTFQNTVVNTIQWTSVVGYITITDLTRAVNNAAARSPSPLFPLVCGGILYLLLSYLATALFSLGGKERPA